MPTLPPYDLSERAVAGREVYARNFGVSPAEAERRMIARAGPAFTREAYEAAGGPGWQSDVLTDRDRSVAVIAALVSQGVTDDRLATYLSLARRNGVGTEGLIALMVLLSAYLGQPHTSLGAEAVLRSARAEQ
ncbi:carboxymuconolactone decarboxylase family protein [Actinoplanes sp. M2I2]|uniref:carboxymuconolactone decarboxylase family protein n=1 Tax=Actinoplanes sp. M2I2 TaxID=1734444 RepID=UPI002021DDAE|nr:carboxymuconolactone decarboxylase family protein [Actinoplanes sp. M2I2]